MLHEKPTPPTPRAFGALLLTALVLLASLALAQPQPDSAKAAVGRSVYRGYCGSCHGKQALGDGPVAQYLDPRPSDLTRIRERREGEFPFDEIYRIIDGRQPVPGHGSSEMPVWGEAFKVAGAASEEEVQGKINALAHYLMSIQVPAAD